MARSSTTALLVGSAGLGKTQIAKVIADELRPSATKCWGSRSPVVRRPQRRLAGGEGQGRGPFRRVPRTATKNYQTALYLAIDQRRIVLQGGRSGEAPQSIPLADFTLLLSTTDEYALLQPLRDRMKLLLRFDFYAPEELTEILRHRSRALGWKLDERVFPLIARRSRGTPRLALRLLQACRRVCRSEGEKAITLAHLGAGLPA